MKNADFEGQIDAIGKSQAVIEFDMKGNILSANDNFLKSMGYTLKEVQGRHHSIFVDAEYGASREYKQFWEKLNRGEFESAEFQRFAKNGREVWIQAPTTLSVTYPVNPLKSLSTRQISPQKKCSGVHQWESHAFVSRGLE
nr:PAS domain-containing protein [Enterovibrio nigricans]